MTIEESVWGKITEGAMEAPSVVEGLEVIEKRSGGGAFGVEGEALAEDFRLKGSKAIETAGSLPTTLSEPEIEMVVHFESDSSPKPGIEMPVHFEPPSE